MNCLHCGAETRPGPCCNYYCRNGYTTSKEVKREREKGTSCSDFISGVLTFGSSEVDRIVYRRKKR